MKQYLKLFMSFQHYLVTFGSIEPPFQKLIKPKFIIKTENK